MPKTAIIADDIPFARRVIKEILTNAKYTVLAEAANGDEAIHLFNKYKPDFITLDVVMPVKGGIEAARKILDDNKEAKIIMISAMAHEQLLMEAINAGARDYILKPFSPDDLLKAVDKIMRQDDDSPAAAKGASHG